MRTESTKKKNPRKEHRRNTPPLYGAPTYMVHSPVLGPGSRPWNCVHPNRQSTATDPVVHSRAGRHAHRDARRARHGQQQRRARGTCERSRAGRRTHAGSRRARETRPHSARPPGCAHPRATATPRAPRSPRSAIRQHGGHVAGLRVVRLRPSAERAQTGKRIARAPARRSHASGGRPTGRWARKGFRALIDEFVRNNVGAGAGRCDRCGGSAGSWRSYGFWPVSGSGGKLAPAWPYSSIPQVIAWAVGPFGEVSPIVRCELRRTVCGKSWRTGSPSCTSKIFYERQKRRPTSCYCGRDCLILPPPVAKLCRTFPWPFPCRAYVRL
ncbi:hypothetical protein EDB83DRAFT_885465 [Lactarius deliciosus]|nr:hypothetical protein EDB83DRAFT_885465 [Lactarius deliciosus]